MELKDIFLRKLDSFLNPKIESKMILGFLSLGTLLVGGPSIMALSASFSVKNKDTTFTAEINNGPDLILILIGVICLVISAYFYSRKLKKDEEQGIEKSNLTEAKDKKTIISILKSINTNVIDEAIDRGSYSQFYHPVLHYYMGVEGLAESSAFKIYDSNLNGIFNDFYSSFSAFTSHGANFRETVHPDLYRFVKSHEIGNWKKHEEYENAYLADVRAFASAYSRLITYVKNNYPDIDLDDTNKEAWDDYQRYNN